MYKFMIILCMTITNIACAQQEEQGETVQLYPYLDSEGRFGYVDQNFQMRIQPQYKSASFFTKHGFAVVTDSLNKEGVINQDSQFVIKADYLPKSIHLYELDGFTLAEIRKKYYSTLRFWEWKFLPGFSLSGGGNDKRLFDTQVERLKKTVLVLGPKTKKVISERISVSNSKKKYFNIRTLDSNQVIIGGTLYNINKKGVHSIAQGITEQISENTFAQRKGQRLYIVDRSGKQVNKDGYTLLDSIAFKVEDVPIGKPLSREYAPIASAYRNAEGLTFIYPDFAKPLPWLIHDNMHPDDPTAEELIRGLWTLASVPESEYFLFMSFRDGKPFFRFLDTQGNWHQTLPSDIPFTVTQRSGDILWPPKDHYIPQNQVPEGWKIDWISGLSDSSMYHMTLRHDKTVRQGIWDFDKQEWLIAPEYYEVYPMDNPQYWRYHSEHDGLWGIMDYNGKVMIKPTYYSLHPDGWVEHREKGKYISFYLNPSTLKEYREK